jgi:hypothetical protein
LIGALAAAAKCLGGFAEVVLGCGQSPGRAARAIGLLTLASCLRYGQAQTPQYVEYPVLAGKTHEYHWSRLPSWLKFDSEIRGRLDGQTAYKNVSGDDEVYGLTRVRGGVSLDATEYLRFHLQFQDTHAPGLVSHLVASNMHDTFDLREGWAALRQQHVELYVGRQELKFGGERLVGVSDFTNNARTFDGVDLRLGEKNTVDIFSTSVVITHPTSLDTHGGGLTFHGVYGRFNANAATSLEPFVFIKALPHLRSSRGQLGDELATTFGAEVEGNIHRIVEFDGLAALQRGSFAGASIQAGAFYIKAIYATPRLFWSPRFGVEYDWASGNSASPSRTVGTFDQQYPSNHNAFGLTDIFGFENIRQTRANFDLAPAKHLTLLIQAEGLNLASVNDALYGSAGTPLVKAPTGGFLSDRIGFGVDASAKYVFHEALVWNAGMARLQGANTLRLAGLAQNQTYAYLSMTYRFRIEK